MKTGKEEEHEAVMKRGKEEEHEAGMQRGKEGESSKIGLKVVSESIDLVVAQVVNK